MTEIIESLKNIGNPLALFGLGIIVLGGIFKLLPAKNLDPAQVDRLLHKFINCLFIFGILGIIVGMVRPYPPPNNPGSKTESKDSTSNKPELGIEAALDEKVCNSLIGKYKLLHGYDFLAVDKSNDPRIASMQTITGLKSKTIDGYWNAHTCNRDDKGNMVLHGIDESVHIVKVRIENEYKKVAVITRKLNSMINIDKDGKLYRRKLEINHEYEIKESEKIWEPLISSYGSAVEEEIKQAIAYYKFLIHERHAHKTQHSCYATVGEIDKKNLVISYCPTNNEGMYPLYYRGMLECTEQSSCKSFFNNLNNE